MSIRIHLTLFATLAFAAAALAADAGTGAPPLDNQDSLRKSCLDDPVLARLRLTAEQVRALDAIFADIARQYDELLRAYNDRAIERMTDRECTESYRTLERAIEGLYGERKRKTREFLPVDLRSKYDKGQDVMEAVVQRLMERIFAGEKDPQVARDAMAEMEQQLDEKIGKRPDSGLSLGSSSGLTTALVVGGLTLALVLGLVWFVRRRKAGAAAGGG